MDGIKLKISKPKDKLPAGSSKLFGNPDVWNGFEWPYIEENGEKYDLTFMCQINCTDSAVFDKDELLPKTGILYFFYDLDTMPEATDEKSARVLRYNGELSALHEGINFLFEVKEHQGSYDGPWFWAVDEFKAVWGK